MTIPHEWIEATVAAHLDPDSIKRGAAKATEDRMEAALAAVLPLIAADLLEPFTKAVEKLAFEMPPPNEYTPRLVQMCIEQRAMLRAWAREHGVEFEEEPVDKNA